MHQKLSSSVLLIIAIIFMVICAKQSSAAIRNVPATYATVQIGIDSASAGDTVLVAPGRYFENVIIAGKAVILASNFLFSGDPDEIFQTIIDGSTPTFVDTASCVRIYQANGTAVIGLVMTGGKGTDLFDIGDANYYREGGGLIADQSIVEIRHNVFAFNLASEIGPGVTSAGGGGIRVGFTDSALIIGNLFLSNQGAYGAGAVVFRSSVDFRNNIMWQNLGGGAFGGGGLWIVGNDLPGGKSRVDNNTIVQNNGTTNGGGIQIGSSAIFLRNNIVRNNTATSNPQVTLFGGTTATYNDVSGGLSGSTNFDLAPLFDAANFLLKFSSPGVDAGDTAAVFRDLEDPMTPGMAIHPAQGTIRNDVGAYGGQNAVYWPDFTRVQLHADTAFDFGYVPQSGADTSFIPIFKNLIPWVTVDSVKFRGPSGATHKNLTTLPLTMKVSTLDSLRITWKPFFPGVIADTMLVFHNDTSKANPLRITLRGTTIAPGCCQNNVGNVDCSVGDAVDIGDLTVLVDHLFISFTPLCCTAEANTDGVTGIDIGDLTTLVDHLFINFTPLPSCS